MSRPLHFCGCTAKKPCKSGAFWLRLGNQEKLRAHLESTMVAIHYPSAAAAAARDAAETPIARVAS